MARILTQEQQEKLDRVVKKAGLDKKWEERGKQEGKLEVAQKLISIGLELEKIVEATELPEDEIKKLMH